MDVLKTFMENTGWSSDKLLHTLIEYRNVDNEDNSKSQESPSETPVLQIEEISNSECCNQDAVNNYRKSKCEEYKTRNCKNANIKFEEEDKLNCSVEDEIVYYNQFSYANSVIPETCQPDVMYVDNIYNNFNAVKEYPTPILVGNNGINWYNSTCPINAFNPTIQNSIKNEENYPNIMNVQIKVEDSDSSPNEDNQTDDINKNVDTATNDIFEQHSNEEYVDPETEEEFQNWNTELIDDIDDKVSRNVEIKAESSGVAEIECIDLVSDSENEDVQMETDKFKNSINIVNVEGNVETTTNGWSEKSELGTVNMGHKNINQQDIISSKTFTNNLHDSFALKRNKSYENTITNSLFNKFCSTNVNFNENSTSKDKSNLVIEEHKHYDDFHTDTTLDITKTNITEINKQEKNQLPLDLYELDCNDLGNNNSQSAFVSDVLEQYLLNDSDLNINNYEVPTIHSEETIAKSYTEEFPTTSQTANVKSPTSKTANTNYKPKTLAEKRKMLLRLQGNIEKDKDEVSCVKNKLFKEDSPFIPSYLHTSVDATNATSFVLYNGKRYKVPSGNNNRIVASIKDKTRLFKTTKKIEIESTQNISNTTVSPKTTSKKPSILNSIRNNIFDREKWEAVVLNLPKISLEITPEVGKRINPKVEHLILNDETVLDESRINFALSMVVVKNRTQVPQKFTFPLSYANNKNTVSLYKKLPELITPKLKIYETDFEINQSVKNVVNKMLDYIDLSQEFEEQGEYQTSDARNTTPSPNLKKGEKAKYKLISHSGKLHKTALEMKRLNCKILNIQFDLDGDVGKVCPKDFCKLGCVCHSIGSTTNRLLTPHCELVKCMFQCRCKLKDDPRKEVHTNSDIFSERIMNKLDDEAKKDLAKEEKEFTQTLIKTGNQLIMLGNSKERKKRITKPPKKYNDFVEPRLVEDEFVPLREISSTSIGSQDSKVKPCFVKLRNYNFKGIIPFCLVHLVYNCHCKNNTITLDDQNVINCEANDSPYLSKVSPRKSECTRKSNRKPKTNKLYIDVDDIHSSRTRGVPLKYTLRNTSLNLPHTNNLFGNVKRSLKNPLKSLDTFTETKNKRKNSISGLYALSNNEHEEPSEVEITCSPDIVNKRIIEPTITTENTTPDEHDVATEFVSTMEIEASSTESDKLKKDFITLLTNYNTLLRLLSWTKFIAAFEDNTFQIWCCNNSKSRYLIVTEDNIRPGRNYYNIRLLIPSSMKETIPNDMIYYILNKKVPFSKKSDSVFVILFSYEKSYKICGICEKDISDVECKNSLSLSPIKLYIDLDILPRALNEKLVTDNSLETITPEILEKSKKIMLCHRLKFRSIKLTCDDIQNDSDLRNTEKTLWSCLPVLAQPCRWRVIYMSVEFSFLTLVRPSYTVKYSDLIKCLKLAHLYKSTIALKSEETKFIYSLRNFGIYCVPDHRDKIFVGPFAPDENHNIITFNYVCGVLCKSSMFNQLKDDSVPGNGLWFNQDINLELDTIDHDDSVVIIDGPTEVVDLTGDSDEESYSTIIRQETENNFDNEDSNSDATIDSNTSDSENSKFGNFTSENENVQEGCENYKNRKILITNIPHVGYMLAYECKNYVQVVCPITGNLKRFDKCVDAIADVQRRLTGRFIFVPPTFKLTIAMLDYANVNDMAPLKRSILNRYHIAGEFGVKNAMEMTEKELLALGMDQDNAQKLMQMCEQKFLLVSMNNLASLLNIEIKSLPYDESLQSILDLTKQEIANLKQKSCALVHKKYGLESKKKFLVRQVTKLAKGVGNQNHIKTLLELNGILEIDLTNNKNNISPLPSEQKKSSPVGSPVVIDFQSETITKSLTITPILKVNSEQSSPRSILVKNAIDTINVGRKRKMDETNVVTREKVLLQQTTNKNSKEITNSNIIKQKKIFVRNNNACKFSFVLNSPSCSSSVQNYESNTPTISSPETTTLSYPLLGVPSTSNNDTSKSLTAFESTPISANNNQKSLLRKSKYVVLENGQDKKIFKLVSKYPQQILKRPSTSAIVSHPSKEPRCIFICKSKKD